MSTLTIRVRARPDETPSRWLWLVKWLLLIPHYVVLAFLGVAFVVLTLVAYVAVLFTGRYPEPVFQFNVGVLRWSWRVGYYGYQVLGTDRYPPFTLAEVPDYPAGLTIDGPPRPRRWLPLVAWLLAIPHLVILGALNGAAGWEIDDGDGAVRTVASLSVIGAAVLVVGLGLLFTGRRLTGLHDLLVGVGRWTLRTVAYVALLTDRYPPFRLDQGPAEPDDPDPVPRTAPPGGTAPATAGSPNRAAAVVAVVTGVLLVFTSVGLGAAGAAVLTLNGERDATGTLTSPTLNVASPTAAVTVEGVQPGDLWTGDLRTIGAVRVTATGDAGAGLFLGVARQRDVDTWLNGTAHDQLVQVYSEDGARYDRADGALRPVSAPADQRFWIAQASGAGTVELDWAGTAGTYAVVLANVDGSPGVTATTRVAMRVPDLAPLGWGLAGGATALAVLAFVLIYLGATGLGRRHTPAPPPPAPGPPTAAEARPPAAVG
ncbi:DUF4389 domain-containing protein [Spirilliplanes yamanashiensis]|uniref:DUF4389 domain-containing protein n=1 Tax=Spirilliplanes yamanashiensis TaxID=42233 RepID=A0A8J3YAN5_9ACTN|nr:DUF4389 domain-containing protein [Spirilliplanes yamanashiensis]MDP9818202.1 hypothetical protein [Spirilliplanes yamanashiensis]GIJ05013.1 hypothetical protein Sya03_43650 [Spirilliplanes yamanashiensis]